MTIRKISQISQLEMSPMRRHFQIILYKLQVMSLFLSSSQYYDIIIVRWEHKYIYICLTNNYLNKYTRMSVNMILLVD